MQLSALGDAPLESLGALLTSGGLLALALAREGLYRAFRSGARWRFGTLLLDGERAHSPPGVFAAVVTEDIQSLSVANLGAQLFHELPRWPFLKLRALQFTDCLFEGPGAAAVAQLVERHGVRSLILRHCFLTAADVARLAAVAGPLVHLELCEQGLAAEALDGALAALLRGSQLRQLALEGSFRPSPELLDAITELRGLEVLILAGHALLSNAAVASLSARLARTAPPQLAQLRLSTRAASSLDDDAARALGHALQRLPGLTELHLAGHHFTKAGLVSVLAGGAQLKVLDFTGNSLGASCSSDDELAAAVALPPLRVLRVGGCPGGPPCGDPDVPEQTPLQSLAWVSGSLRSLRVLDVSHANIDDAALAAFAAAMAAEGAVALDELNLAGNFITEDGAAALVDGLQQGGARLLRLDLAFNGLADEGCEAVGLALQPGAALTSVQSLSFRANSVGDVKAICAGLPSSSLRELDLRENLLTDSDVRQLRTADTSRGLLLRLAGNELCEEELLDEEQQAPHCAAQHVDYGPGEDLTGCAGLEQEFCEEALPSAAPLQLEASRVPKALRGGPSTFEASLAGVDHGLASVLSASGPGTEPAVADGWEVPELDKALNGDETPPSPSTWEKPWEGLTMAVSREEWQECLDTLEWAESCIRK